MRLGSNKGALPKEVQSRYGLIDRSISIDQVDKLQDLCGGLTCMARSVTAGNGHSPCLYKTNPFTFPASGKLYFEVYPFSYGFSGRLYSNIEIFVVPYDGHFKERFEKWKWAERLVSGGAYTANSYTDLMISAMSDTVGMIGGIFQESADGTTLSISGRLYDGYNSTAAGGAVSSGPAYVDYYSKVGGFGIGIESYKDTPPSWVRKVTCKHLDSDLQQVSDLSGSGSDVYSNGESVHLEGRQCIILIAINGFNSGPSAGISIRAHENTLLSPMAGYDPILPGRYEGFRYDDFSMAHIDSNSVRYGSSVGLNISHALSNYAYGNVRSEWTGATAEFMNDPDFIHKRGSFSFPIPYSIARTGGKAYLEFEATGGSMKFPSFLFRNAGAETFWEDSSTYTRLFDSSYSPHNIQVRGRDDKYPLSASDLYGNFYGSTAVAEVMRDKPVYGVGVDWDAKTIKLYIDGIEVLSFTEANPLPASLEFGFKHSYHSHRVRAGGTGLQPLHLPAGYTPWNE